MKYLCLECRTSFVSRPPLDCPVCSNGNVVFQEDSAPEKPSGVQTETISEELAIKKILLEMAEEIHGSPYSNEIFFRIVDRAIERLKRETVKA